MLFFLMYKLGNNKCELDINLDIHYSEAMNVWNVESSLKCYACEVVIMLVKEINSSF